jgi:hypothetical protein
VTGNRCGHDPKRPNLSPAHSIRKGKGGLPRILSLAAERAKAWYNGAASKPEAEYTFASDFVYSMKKKDT